MGYQKTLQWLFHQLPMYQNAGKIAYKANLNNTIALADHLNNPQKHFKSIHVGGTNGKGSTCHMLTSILQEAGYNVGLYTSPHLKDFRERIKINGKPVSKAFVVDFIQQNKSFFEQFKLSFFEMTVGMAFSYFKAKNVDIAIIEVGMGGRLDSTNIIFPEVSVITNIGLDHTQFLGHTIAAIAQEKAGIIKPKTPVVIGETQPISKTIFKAIAKQQQADIYFAEDSIVQTIYNSDLKGLYQQKNIKTVLKTISILGDKGYNISEGYIKKGLLHVVKNTGLQGRWQILQQHPKVICDTAHNKEGLTYVIKQLLDESYNTLHIVFGVVNDKDLTSILPLLPKQAQYYCCKPNITRGLDAHVLTQMFLQNGFNASNFTSVNAAYKEALFKAHKNDLIFVGGSTFVVAEVV